MIFNNGSRFPEYPEQIPRSGAGGFTAFSPVATKTLLAGQFPGVSNPEQPTFHGEALARDPQLERYGSWIVVGFTAVFALFLIGMNLAGQAPGQSFLLKSISDILQFAGEAIGLVFCIRIATRLRRVSTQLWRNLWQHEAEYRQRGELSATRAEAQAARRAFLAWTLLAVAIALYASGQAAWTSYDVRMPSFQVPFPGLYDIGFVGSYPFFLLGTLLLTRRNRAGVGRARLLLDALSVLGAALALSWFFVLSPSIAGLSHAPSPGAAFLSIYFPTGDLFLVAVGAFLMFSPLSNREQQPVFLRLCLGLFFLAITDSLLGYFSLSPSGFNTGTLQDILWPLSMSLIGLAAIEYPRSVAREQEQTARANNSVLSGTSLLVPGRGAQISLTAQTVAPFILALFTCAILLTIVPNLGGKSLLIQADTIALALILLVVVRQALTLIENNRLTMQVRGELVISRRELQVKSREADEATQAAQEKRILEEGVSTLQQVHARVARGDFSARAPTTPGPLMPIAMSFNLMLDRLLSLAQRANQYEYMVRDSNLMQEALDRLSKGFAAWSPDEPAPQSTPELRPLFFGLLFLQRFQISQWKSLLTTVETIGRQTQHLRIALARVTSSGRSRDTAALEGDQASIEQLNQAAAALEQHLQHLASQIRAVLARLEEPAPQVKRHEQLSWQNNRAAYNRRQGGKPHLVPDEQPPSRYTYQPPAGNAWPWEEGRV